MKLFWITKTDVDKEKDVEDATQLESAEVVLVHSNLVNNKYQQASKYYLLLYQISNLDN